MCEDEREGVEQYGSDLQHLGRVNLALLAQGMVDVVKTDGAVLGGLPEQILRVPQEFLDGVGPLQTLTEGEEISAGSVEELGILYVGVAAREEVVDDHVVGSGKLCCDERVGRLEDSGSRDAPSGGSGVDAGVYVGEFETVRDGLQR